jgi:hypothetical protein
MPLDINDVETPKQKKEREDAEALKSTESNNNSSQPVIPKSSNFAGISLHDLNPYQTDQQGNIDYGASALRAIPEASVGYLGLKALQGAGEGLKRTISGENRGIKVQERQLKLQEKEGIKPTVTSETGIDPKLALEMRLKEEKHIAEERRAEEIHKAKLESMGAKSTAPVASVSPALQGSTVELPNTATLGIQTEPTATAESALSMLPSGAPSVPQGSVPGAPNTQGVPGTLPANPPAPPAPLATPPATPAQQVIEQTTGTAPKPPVSNQSAIGEVSVNPVESGSEANPLHEQGSEVGKTQIEATSDSTNPNVEGKQRGGVSGKPRNNPTKAEREAKQQAELKVIQDANLEPTHHLTREEIANKPMHPEMKRIIEEGNKQIESDPKLKADIEKLKATHKVPEGFVFIPGMGGQDVHFINSYGFEKYRKAKEDLMGGKPLGDYRIQPGAEKYDPEFHKALKEWSERNLPASKIAGIPSMTGKENGLAAPEDTNFLARIPEELKPRFLKAIGTAGKVGGVAMTLVDLANAKTAAKHGNPEEAQKYLGNALMGLANPFAGYMGQGDTEESQKVAERQIKGAVVPK